jgi:hypothetical protein
MCLDQRPAITAATDVPRVLLVDPYEQPRVVLARFLLEHGVQVAEAVPNYAQAIVAARAHGAGLSAVVTELCAGQVLSPERYIGALRRHTPAPIIVHSAIVPSPHAARAWRLWGTHAKGERPGELLALIRSAHAAATRVGR